MADDWIWVETRSLDGLHAVVTVAAAPFSVNELAAKVAEAGASLGLKVEVRHLPNPRVEAEEHYYNPAHTGLLELGLKPNPLTQKVLERQLSLIMQYKDSIYRDCIFRNVRWK